MTKSKLVFFMPLFLLFMEQNYAQFEINYFIATQINENVKLSWEVSTGSTCNGMQIERSTDSINYFYIGQIDGVCGSSSAAQKFEFIDINPAPFKRNYYRIIASSGESFYQSIFYNYVKDSYCVVQNPVSSSSILYFKQNQQFIVTFYDLWGKAMNSKVIQTNMVTLGELLTIIPNTLFLLDVEAENGSHETLKLIGNQ